MTPRHAGPRCRSEATVTALDEATHHEDPYHPDWTPKGSRRGILRTLAFFFAGLVPRIVVFAVLMSGLMLGALTTPIWIGLPILVGTFTLARWLCEKERGWIG